MKIVRMGALACALGSLVACGGDTKPVTFDKYVFGPNTAHDATFTYGSASELDAATASSLGDQSVYLPQLKNLSATAVVGSFSPTTAITATMLGDQPSPATALAGPVRQQALVIARDVELPESRAALTAIEGFTDPSCAQETVSQATYHGCVYVMNDGSTQLTARLDGSIAWDEATGHGTWDLTFQLDLVSPDAAVSAAQHGVGDFTATATTLRGSFLNQTSGRGMGNGKSVDLALDESLDMDLTYQADTSPSCVTGGTLETKRIWVLRPAGLSVDTSDKAAQVTFNGCNTAVAAHATHPLPD